MNADQSLSFIIGNILKFDTLDTLRFIIWLSFRIPFRWLDSDRDGYEEPRSNIYFLFRDNVYNVLEEIGHDEKLIDDLYTLFKENDSSHEVSDLLLF